MLSKNKIKFVNSLHKSKYRKINRKYIVEGHKPVLEWLENGNYIDTCYASKKWVLDYPEIYDKYREWIEIAEEKDIKACSQLTNFSPVILIANMPEEEKINSSLFENNNLILVLDRIQDPGNLGTIIRSADWFGLKKIIVLKGTVDTYNNKVIQSSMGSVLRVDIIEMEEEELLLFAKENDIELLVADMEGAALEKQSISKPSFLILGNEGQGVSLVLQNKANKKLKIHGKGGAESLNVAISAAVFLFALDF